MAQRGRRPGDPGTRDTILVAARTVFLDEGFNKATVTGVARSAGVDPALVYHYFGTKVDLFIESMVGHHPEHRSGDGEDQSRAAPVPTRLGAGQTPSAGVQVVTGFLTKYEYGVDQPGQAFVAIAQAASGSTDAADSLQRFIVAEFWKPLLDLGADSPAALESRRRAAMVASQLVGLAWTRYVLRLEPIASAPLDDVAAWYGPTIDAYLSGPAPLTAGRRPRRGDVASSKIITGPAANRAAQGK